MMKDVTLEFEIQNFKSYFKDPHKVKIEKPITLIVGPNGEGKTNLLQAMLIVLDEFTRRHPTIQGRSLFTKAVRVSRKSRLQTSLGNSIIYVESRRKGEKLTYGETYTPEAVLSHGYRHCTLSFSLRRPRINRKGEVTLAQCTVGVSGSPPKYFVDESKRKISNLEVIYLSPEGPSIDVFVKLIGQEFSRLIRNQRGEESRHRFFKEIMESFPFDEERLVRDIENGEFNEVYSDNRLFLTKGLATSAKKELILYSIGLAMERNKAIDDWMAVLLLDELGQGLHLSRQTEFADALVSTLGKDGVRDHIRLIATTHSPLIYSKLAKRKDLVDVYFVLREKNQTSKIASWGEGDDTMIEKMLTTKLWLNMFTLPEKLVFVEGKTDKLFFDCALSQVSNKEIFRLCGASIPNVLLDLLKELPLARRREYYVIGDESGVETLMSGAKKLEEAGSHLEVINTGYDSLEEFILGIPKEIQGTELWDLLASQLKALEEDVKGISLELPHIDVDKVRRQLEPEGQKGVNSFLESLKKKHQIYEIIGEHWTKLLPEDSRGVLKKIIEKIEHE